MNLLLLRGLVRDQRCWGEFPSRLAVHAPHLKPWFIDLPGVGTECTRECPGSVAAIRIDIAKRFHENIARGKFPEGPWSILAVSLGAMIAIDWVNSETQLFKNLFVISTSASNIGRPTERFPLRFIPALARAVISLNPVHTETLMFRMASNRHQELTHLIEKQIAWRKERPVTRKTLFRQLGSAARFELPESRPVPRTLVISSEGDRMVSPKISERIAQRFGAQKVTHPWAGHDIAIDDPEWLSKRVAEFIPDPDAPKVGFRS